MTFWGSWDLDQPPFFPGRSPNPLWGDHEGFKTNGFVKVDGRDGSGVHRARTIIVRVPPSLRGYSRKMSGDHPESKRMRPYYSTKKISTSGRGSQGGSSSTVTLETTKDQ